MIEQPYLGRKPGDLVREFLPWAVGRPTFTVREVSEQFGISLSRCSSFLWRLRAQGLIRIEEKAMRRADGTFERGILYCITASGERRAAYLASAKGDALP